MRIKPLLFLSFVFFILSFSRFPAVYGQVDFPFGSSFHYLKGKDAGSLDPAWMNPGFEDSIWSEGHAPFRYGDGTGGTILDDMQYNYSVVYMRSSFTATHVDSLENLLCSVDYDDGFVVWINGLKVLSKNAPAVLFHDGFSSGLRESGVVDVFHMDLNRVDLKEGENTLAIQAFNTSLTSTDFYMDLALNAEVIQPVLHDSLGLYFSMSSGFYEDTFSVEIQAADPSWNVVYTLDGSNPQDSETALSSESTVRILIDPAESTGRPKTPAVIVRASASLPGIKPAVPESRTYIFPKKVLIQSNPYGGWPTASVNEQLIDLNMDSQIVNDGAYAGLMIPALTDIPSISLITDLDHLFHPETGIYVNAEGHGHAWERECSVEMINPDGSEGFGVNGGLRIRGGWSRHADFSKHSFRLFFRSEYGDPKLYFPLFGEEGVGQYDKIDLRTAQNYAWSTGSDRNTFLRDVFSRDTQGDMDQPYTRSRYYHLYLNGMYWGLYQTQERSEARFAADYFGGKTNEYDVVKVNTENYVYQIEATDGNLDSWYELWDMCKSGFKSNSEYFRLLGRDEHGNPVRGGQIYLDMDNLIDYMLTIFYTGNFDAPTSTFGGNKGPNNFYAIDNREDRSRGFVFFNHDAEHSLFADVVEPGTGLNEDRVNLTQLSDGNDMDVTHFGAFHPQWLHHKLCSNPEYRIRFMDRAHLHLSAKGALTDGACNKRLDRRALEIDKAIIAESARWGDARPWVTTPFNRNDHWVPQVQKIKNEFFPFRTGIVIGQLNKAKLYTTLAPPVCYVNNEILLEHRFYLDGSATFRLEHKNREGTIYYTTNGMDPRKAGGGVSPDAMIQGDGKGLIRLHTSGVIKARIYFDGQWSALTHVDVLSENDDYSKLAITELHYHPPELVEDGDTISGKDLEFIELKNTGYNAINLSGLVLDSAVYCEFPAETLLPPGQFFVIASKPSAFYLRYGLVASANYKKNLSNGGEKVLLSDGSGNPLISFTFSDDPPWPTEADGYGYSLVPASDYPNANPGLYSDWKRSGETGGSPFADDSQTLTGIRPDQDQTSIHVYPNPTSGLLHIELPEDLATLHASLALYGIKGELVYSMEMHGNSTIQLDQLKLAGGIYMLRIETGTGISTKKIIYNK
ncbi:MAG: CotH kinase family protein [Bacteroidota bacterium]